MRSETKKDHPDLSGGSVYCNVHCTVLLAFSFFSERNIMNIIVAEATQDIGATVIGTIIKTNCWVGENSCMLLLVCMVGWYCSLGMLLGLNSRGSRLWHRPYGGRTLVACRYVRTVGKGPPTHWCVRAVPSIYSMAPAGRVAMYIHPAGRLITMELNRHC